LSVARLGPDTAANLLVALVRENMRWFHRACVNLLNSTVRNLGSKLGDSWKQALGKVAVAIVVDLPQLEAEPQPDGGGDWWRARESKPVDADMVSKLLDSLKTLEAGPLRFEAVQATLQNPTVFLPDTVVLPALGNLQSLYAQAFAFDRDCVRLWRHAAEFLLTCSESPPITACPR